MRWKYFFWWLCFVCYFNLLLYFVWDCTFCFFLFWFFTLDCTFCFFLFWFFTLLWIVLFLSFYFGVNKKKEKVPKRKKNQRNHLEFARISRREICTTRAQISRLKIQQFYVNPSNFVALCAVGAYKPPACKNEDFLRFKK